MSGALFGVFAGKTESEAIARSREEFAVKMHLDKKEAHVVQRKTSFLKASRPKKASSFKSNANGGASRASRSASAPVRALTPHIELELGELKDCTPAADYA